MFLQSCAAIFACIASVNFSPGKYDETEKNIKTNAKFALFGKWFSRETPTQKEIVLLEKWFLLLFNCSRFGWFKSFAWALRVHFLPVEAVAPLMGFCSGCRSCSSVCATLWVDAQLSLSSPAQKHHNFIQRWANIAFQLFSMILWKFRWHWNNFSQNLQSKIIRVAAKICLWPLFCNLRGPWNHNGSRKMSCFPHQLGPLPLGNADVFWTI